MENIPINYRADYRQYNGPWFTRTYSSKVIIENLGKIPEDAKKVPIPKFLEKIVGSFYVVNQLDKYNIDGNNNSALILIMIEEGKVARARTEYELQTRLM